MINLSKGIPLEKFFPEIKPNHYLIFKEGGPHYFSQCKKDIDPIYRQNIWPFIYSYKTRPKGKKSSIILGSIGSSKLSYINQRLFTINKTIKKSFNSNVKINIRETFKDREYRMHRLVATVFVSNPDPKKYNIVDHINGNRVDYRVVNLRWVNIEMNSRGTPGGKNDPDEVYKLISKKKWFNGEGANQIITHKVKWLNLLNET